MALAPWQDEALLPAPGFSDTSPRYNIIGETGQVIAQNVKIVLQNIVDQMGTAVNAENMNLIIAAINSILSGDTVVPNASHAVSADSAGTAESATSAGAADSVPWGGVTGKPATFAPSAHNQGANTITAGTFPGNVVATDQAVGTVGLRNIYAGTGDMTPGSTALATGRIYLMYE